MPRPQLSKLSSQKKMIDWHFLAPVPLLLVSDLNDMHVCTVGVHLDAVSKALKSEVKKQKAA